MMWLRWGKTLLWFLIDVFLLVAALYLAFWLRFEGAIPSHWRTALPFFWGISLLIKLPIFWFLGLYRIVWRRVGIHEMMRILAAVVMAQSILGTFYFLTSPTFSEVLSQIIPHLPRSVLILDGLLTFVLVAGVRFAKRFWTTLQGQWPDKASRPVLIVGAGNAGAQLAQLMQTETWPYRIVAFLDDDPNKQGKLLHGIPIYGPRRLLPTLVSNFRVQEVWIAMPSAPGRVLRETVDLARNSGVRHIRVVPPLTSLIRGELHFQDLREVRLEDVLGRDPVYIDTQLVEALLRGAKVLVTGAAGSIGSELCQRILKFRPAVLVALDQDETGLFYLEQDLQERLPDGVRLETVVADIVDHPRIRQVFQQHRPEVVFHAAAYKHVPLMEMHPQEAVKTNVRGTQIVAQTALETGVRKFVLISTDKAVNPTSVMGATKRVAEQLIQYLNAQSVSAEKPTRFVAVRFGNVLGSRGSVFPIFQRQIRRGGPVTVTHPEMKRYFMLPSEAALLVLQAGAMGRGGEVFVLDMGAPIRILDLAREMIRLAGYEPDVDIPIVFTGLRPGEKLFEELLTAEEGTDATEHDKIFIARIHLSHDAETFFPLLTQLYQAAERGNKKEIQAVLQLLVPTYRAFSQSGFPALQMRKVSS